MKNVFKFLVAIVVSSAVLTTSCKKDEDDPKLPEMGETKVVYVTGNSATISAKLVSEGDEYVSDEGVCYGTNPEPTIEDNTAEKSDYEDPDIAEIEDLSQGTTYYVRGFATSDAGTSYGQEISFTTTTPVVDNDGNEYPTVQIGEQIWMAENLRTTTYNDGSSIPNVTGEDEWSELSTPAYCWWENDIEEANDDWGAFYNFYAVKTGKLAPEGWHVATVEDWNELIEFIGENADKIKNDGSSTFGDYNETGFTAYMTGYRASGSGTFGRRGEWTRFWMYNAEELYGEYTFAKELVYESSAIEEGQNDMKMGFSVRCVKD